MGSAEKKPSLSLWDVSTKNMVHLLEDEPYTSVVAMNFDYTGKLLVYSTNDDIFMFDVEGGQREQLLEMPARITKIVSSGTTPRIAISGQQTSVYETQANKTLWSLEDYEGFGITEGLVIPDLPRDWRIKIEAYGFKNEPAVIAISSDGNHIFLGGHNKGTIEKIDVNSGAVVNEIFPAPLQAFTMSLGCTEKVLAVSSKIPHASFLWDLESGSRILPQLFSERFGGYSSLCLHHTKRLLASGTRVGFVSLKSLEDGKPLFSEQLHEGPVSQVIFGENVKKIFSAGDDGSVHIIDIPG